jgi:hypothetical protein
MLYQINLCKTVNYELSKFQSSLTDNKKKKKHTHMYRLSAIGYRKGKDVLKDVLWAQFHLC